MRTGRVACGLAVLTAAAFPSGAQAGTVGDQALIHYVGITPALLFDADRGRYLMTAGSDTGGLTGTAIPRSGPLTATTLFYVSQGNAYFRPDIARNPQADETIVVHRGDGDRIEARIIAADGSSPPERSASLGVDVREPAVAYGSGPNEYLAVWQAPGPDGRPDILARRVSPAGALRGSTVRLSDRTDVLDARLPDVAYRPGTGDFVVVWAGTRANGTTDVFAQRVRADGTETGPDDFRVSDHSGLGGRPENTAPALAADGATDLMLAFSDGYEIYARRLTGTAATPAGKDERLSTMGPTGDAAYRAATPAIAALPRPGGTRWLVTWSGNDTSSPVGGTEAEIFGQEFTRGFAQVGPDDFTISQRSRPYGVPVDGPALDPAVAADPGTQGYLVAWWSDDRQTGDPAYARRVVTATG